VSRPILVSTLVVILLGVIGLGFANPHGQQTDSVQAANQKKPRVVIPEDWRGTWQVSVAYRDQETGLLVNTDVTTAPICPGERILPDSLMRMADCTTLTNDHEISTMCGARHMPVPGCVVFINTALDSRRDGEIWRGVGSWRARVVGFCARPEPKQSCAQRDRNTFGEDFVVSGTRISNQANCNNARRTLLESFFAHSELTPLLGGKE